MTKTKNTAWQKTVVFLLWLFVLPVWAGPLSPLSLRAGGGGYYDNNIYRRSKQNDLPIKGDMVQTILLGANVDKTVSRQHFVVDGQVEWFRYGKQNSDQGENNLNYDTKRLKADWYWVLTDHLSGQMSYSLLRRGTSLADYTPQGDNPRNYEDYRDIRFTGEWKVIEGWRLAGEYNYGRLRNSVLIRKINDYDYDGYSGGFGYNTKAGSQWRVWYRKRLADYPLRLIHKSNRTDVEFSFIWPITVKSNVRGWVAKTDRTYAGNNDRDFNGITGGLRYGYRPTEKLDLVADFSYQLDEEQESYSDYAQGPRLKLTANWHASRRVDVSVSWGMVRRNFSGRLNPYNIDGKERKDDDRSISLNVNYIPIDPLMFRFYYEYQKRGSTMAPEFVTDYKAHMVGLGAVFQF